MQTNRPEKTPRCLFSVLSLRSSLYPDPARPCPSLARPVTQIFPFRSQTGDSLHFAILSSHRLSKPKTLPRSELRNPRHGCDGQRRNPHPKSWDHEYSTPAHPISRRRNQPLPKIVATRRKKESDICAPMMPSFGSCAIRQYESRYVCCCKARRRV